jgi:energy-coupling factor transporter ATP-binding protein EcfA2
MTAGMTPGNMPAMTPGEIRRFFNAANPSRPLDISNSSDLPYYIDFSPVRGSRIIEELSRTILLSEGETCQIVTGHRGSGKSTELLRLKASLEQQGYYVVYVESDKSLDITDVDISDILLVVARHVSESLKGVVRLEPNYFANLFDEIKSLLQTPVDLKSLELSVGIAKITTQARESPKLRSQLRDILEPQTRSLLDSINRDIFEKAIAKLRQQNCKGIVTIVDNLEKLAPQMLQSGRNHLEYLFIERGAQLRRLQCHLVYTVPLEVTFSSQHEQMVDQLGGGISPRVLPMIPTCYQDGREHDEGMSLLKQMVMARAFPNLAAHQRLNQSRICRIFDNSDSLDRLCHISGGRVRNLLSLLFRCLQITDPQITRSILESEIIERQNRYRRNISRSQWQVLQQIARQKTIESMNLENQMLFRNSLVFEYRDRSDNWFDVNPMLRDTPELEIESW